MEVPYLSLKRLTALHREEIQQAAAEVIDSGWYLQGAHVQRFEEDYAAYTGQHHCVSMGNGLDALTIMLRAYKELGVLHEGDEVLVPANTYIATILSISENELIPILIEPRISNFQIDDNLIEQALTPKTRAIMLVHLYGYNALTEKIVDICKAHGLLLLQDCAQAQGLNKVCAMPEYRGVRGASAHSFYPSKNLGALADAGAITTDDTALAEAARAIANYGSHKKYVFKYKGRNSRMDELTAAVLSVKLKYLDEDNSRRRAIAQRYVEEIKAQVVLPPLEGVHHIFPILCPERDRLQSFLQEKGVQTVIHYPIPPHKQECYAQWNSLSLPITERIHRDELSLPLNQAMSDEEVNYIINTLNSFV